MPILDYQRKTSDGCIIIPPFHTGHLGFMPGLEVTVGLITPFKPELQDCELCVTPFQAENSDIFRLDCTMEDRPGVVEKLTHAVSSLNLNIISEETFCIDRLNYHVISLILDWGDSGPQFESPSSNLTNYYKNFVRILPAGDKRYILLFERIITYCGDVIAWTEESNSIPKISFWPFEKRAISSSRHVLLERHEEQSPYNLSLNIPDRILQRIYTTTGQQRGTHITYILVSEPETKTLRIFFPKKERELQFVHVAFIHIDVPGALSAISRVVARANFNIFTSLLRKEDPNNNIWETILEYRGGSKPPSNKAEIPEWIVEIINGDVSSEDKSNLNKYKVSVGLPRYPKTKGDKKQISLKAKDDINVNRKEASIVQLFKETREKLKSKEPSDLDYKIKLLDLIGNRITKTKSSIFLSYPAIAGLHAKLLRDRLKEYFELVEYHFASMDDIASKAIDLIAEADFFVGIWHHEERKDGGVGISPWMPFEYGVAKSLKKKVIIIYSKKLPESIWKRIDAGIAKPEYVDVTFDSITIPIVVDYCKEKWLKLD